MKYKIGIGVSYWDDPKGLLNMLETPNFYENVYVIYVIDGRYAGRNDREENNPELGKAIASSYDKIHYVKMYDVKQIEKRNKYFELAEKDDLDFLIVCDTDETVVFTDGFEQALEMCMVYDSQIFPVDHDHMQTVHMSRPRLFKKPFNFRHRQNTDSKSISHGQLWDNYGKGDNEMIKGMYKYKEDPTTPKDVPHIYLTHDKKFRTKKRVDADYLYYQNNPTR